MTKTQHASRLYSANALLAQGAQDTRSARATAVMHACENPRADENRAAQRALRICGLHVNLYGRRGKDVDLDTRELRAGRVQRGAGVTMVSK